MGLYAYPSSYLLVARSVAQECAVLDVSAATCCDCVCCGLFLHPKSSACSVSSSEPRRSIITLALPFHYVALRKRLHVHLTLQSEFWLNKNDTIVLLLYGTIPNQRL